ncbi:MAG: FimV family protein [Candidatus Berkiella sp.]
MHKVQKLVSACLSCLLFATPTTSFALGMGEIKIKSHLNEPLLATIPLEDAKGIELGDILTSLADTKDYAKAGLEPANWLYQIQFTVKQEKQGIVILLSTPQPIQDPFADLLIQVAWPSGKILKEFTLLLDPPKIVTTQSQSSIAKTQALLDTFSATTQDQAPRRVASTVKQHFHPVMTDVINEGQLHFGGQFGPVEGQTLWSIAKRLVNGSRFSVHQAVMAIAYKNPDAFAHGNINYIKSGAILLLPTQGEISKFSPSTAQRFVEDQTQLGQKMNFYVQNTVKPEKPQKHQEQYVQKQKQQKALKLVANLDNEEDIGTISSTRSQATQQPAVASGVTSNTSQRLTMVEEALDTLKRSNEEITQKNTQLQSQNQALAGELAKKQQEIELLKMSHTSSVQANSTHADTYEHNNAHMNGTQVNTSLHDLNAQPIAEQIPTKPNTPKPEYAIATQDPLLADTKSPVIEEQPRIKEKKLNQTQVKARKASLNTQEPGFDDVASSDVKKSDLMKRNFMFIVFIFALTCSMLGWIWFSRHRLIVLAQWFSDKFKREKTVKSTEQPHLVSDVPQEEIQVNFGLHFDLDKALNAVSEQEKKFLKPLVKDKSKASQNDISDKKSLASLEDAEIYIAYERYQQAEKILQEILAQDIAQDTTYWEALLKLLELYVLTENYTQYEKWASTVPSDLIEIEPKIYSKIKLLADKVSADKAVHVPQKPELSLDDNSENISLATHTIMDLPHAPQENVPEVEEHNITALPTKLELANDDEEFFNSQVSLARTYQDMGDLNMAREVLDKLRPSAQGQEQIDLINSLLDSLKK